MTAVYACAEASAQSSDPTSTSLEGEQDSCMMGDCADDEELQGPREAANITIDDLIGHAGRLLAQVHSNDTRHDTAMPNKMVEAVTTRIYENDLSRWGRNPEWKR